MQHRSAPLSVHLNRSGISRPEPPPTTRRNRPGRYLHIKKIIALPRLSLWRVGLLVLAGLLVLSPNVYGQSAMSAIVEKTAGPPAPVETLDILSQGEEFQLAPGSIVTISYFVSCIRETISGGKVVVGREQSDVVDGQVKREGTECTPDVLKLSEEQLRDSAAFVFRQPPDKLPPLLLLTTKPVLVLFGADKATIESDGAPSIHLQLKDGIVDLSRIGIELVRGTEYRVTVGEDTRRFLVAETASRDETSIVARLVAF